MTPESDEKVGYGKPPKKSQFKPGQSGNPKGRPRRPNTQAEILARIRNEKIRMTIDGKPRWVAPLEAAARRTLQACLKNGKPSDLERLFKLLKEESFDWREDMRQEIERGAQSAMEKIDRFVRLTFPTEGDGEQ